MRRPGADTASKWCLLALCLHGRCGKAHDVCQRHYLPTDGRPHAPTGSGRTSTGGTELNSTSPPKTRVPVELKTPHAEGLCNSWQAFLRFQWESGCRRNTGQRVWNLRNTLTFDVTKGRAVNNHQAGESWCQRRCVDAQAAGNIKYQYRGSA